MNKMNFFFASITVLLFFLPFFCHSQLLRDSDSLKKYTYRLFGYYATKVPAQKDNITKIGGGTGFFIRRNSSIFLITAKHVLTGCTDEGKPKDYVDEMFIWISNDNHGTFLSIKNKLIRDTASCSPPDLSPDMIVVEVFPNHPEQIFSVENLISNPYKIVENCFIAGYPSTSISEPFKLKYVPPSTLILSKDKFYFFTATDSLNQVSKSNFWNYWVESKASKLDSNLHGYSGSPFFVQDSATKKWRIAGILSVQPSNQLSVLGIVKIEIVTEFLTRYKKDNLNN